MAQTDDIPFLKLDRVMSRLPAGTLQRLDRVLHAGELRSVLIRAAILAEIQRREDERK